jgi:endogenous inhibitor of DNA gyrase (YacG/DUF329 family)
MNIQNAHTDLDRWLEESVVISDRGQDLKSEIAARTTTHTGERELVI